MNYISFKNVSKEFMKVEKHCQTTQAGVGQIAGSKEFTKMLTVSLCGYFYTIVHIFQISCKENILFLEFKKIMFLKSLTLNPLNPNILSRKMCTHVFFFPRSERK